MENATKALIIAAAILIAIVLISLGVFVLGNGTQLVKDNSDMSATQVTAYNAEWEAYTGTNVMGSKVKQLKKAVDQHNRATEGDTSKTITIDGPDSVESGKGYIVTIGESDYTSGGLVSTIHVEERK